MIERVIVYGEDGSIVEDYEIEIIEVDNERRKKIEAALLRIKKTGQVGAMLPNELEAVLELALEISERTIQ